MEKAFRSGDRILYNQARNTLIKEIRVAKRSYAEKLKKSFSVNDLALVWRSMKDITNYRKPPLHTVENHQVADDLNLFYCMFDNPRFTPSPTLTSNNHLLPLPPCPPPHCSPTCTQDLWKRCVGSFRDRISGRHQDQVACLPPAW